MLPRVQLPLPVSGAWAPRAGLFLVGGCLGSRACFGRWGGGPAVYTSLGSGLDNFAVCCRNVATCIVDVASHYIVGEVRLQNDVLWVHMHLEDVVPGLHIGDVNPLAVDVCVVRVIAAWAQALGVRGAGIALEVAEVTGAVLQAEAGLVALGHLLACGCV